MTRRSLPGVLALLIAGCATQGPPSSSAGATAEATSPTPAVAASATPSSSSPSATPSPVSLAWAPVDAPGPAAREDHTWTIDLGDGLAYLFGGRNGAAVFADLWTYDLASDAWSQLSPPGGPPARFGHDAVWVDGIGLVIFAGQAGPTFFNDLWAYDPDSSTWRALLATGDLPVARYGSCAAIGPDERLWISHGFTADQVRFSDTVAFDFESNAWTDETPDAGARPVERCLHGCWWTDDGELALYAGQTTGATAIGDRWTFDGDAWTRVEGDVPPHRNLYARTRLDGATLVFGGQAVDSSFLADLWLLADGVIDAEPLSADVAGPSGRAGAEMISDTDRDRVLLFGGRDDSGAYAEVWELSGTIVEGG
ncbi:MAG TPA: kelch repeat-containing protein [Candidatus Binatia bacterium]|nr:kelch repeat-containing protein [Candidatus Binatia bacterium]